MGGRVWGRVGIRVGVGAGHGIQVQAVVRSVVRDGHKVRIGIVTRIRVRRLDRFRGGFGARAGFGEGAQHRARVRG